MGDGDVRKVGNCVAYEREVTTTVHDPEKPLMTLATIRDNETTCYCGAGRPAEGRTDIDLGIRRFYGKWTPVDTTCRPAEKEQKVPEGREGWLQSLLRFFGGDRPESSRAIVKATVF